MTWINPFTGLNLTSIVITNFFGIILMLILLLSKGWMVRAKRNESTLVLLMIFSIIIGCIFEPLSFILDGRPGLTNHIMLYVINTVVFSLNVIVGPSYVSLITSHINKTLSPIQNNVIKILCVLEMGMLIVNVFYPIIFTIDKNNIYQRKFLFWIFVAIEAGMLLYGLIVFIIARGKGKLLRFFPAWQFFIPIVIGMVVQGLMYGVSVLWPSLGIAVCSIVVCLQNENIFLDRLTGVYNRYYLDEIQKGVKSKNKGTFGAMMLDMNGFKNINDNYSHAEGDEALKNVAKILISVIKSNGTIVRFAGDEFVVVLKTTSLDELNTYKNAIFKAFEDYNATSGKPYKLSVAIGAEIYDFNDGNISDFLNDIDTLMYQDKENYYKTHDRRSSR